MAGVVRPVAAGPLGAEAAAAAQLRRRGSPCARATAVPTAGARRGGAAWAVGARAAQGGRWGTDASTWTEAGRAAVAAADEAAVLVAELMTHFPPARNVRYSHHDQRRRRDRRGDGTWERGGPGPWRPSPRTSGGRRWGTAAGRRGVAPKSTRATPDRTRRQQPTARLETVHQVPPRTQRAATCGACRGPLASKILGSNPQTEQFERAWGRAGRVRRWLLHPPGLRTALQSAPQGPSRAEPQLPLQLPLHDVVVQRPGRGSTSCTRHRRWDRLVASRRRLREAEGW